MSTSTIEKETKEDDWQAQTGIPNDINTCLSSSKIAPSSNNNNNSPPQKEPPLTLLKTLIGECLCVQSFPLGENRGLSQSAQCVELLGIQFIGLGAVVDELTPRERVYDTLEQLTVRTERLISIGYLVEDDTPPPPPPPPTCHSNNNGHNNNTSRYSPSQLPIENNDTRNTTTNNNNNQTKTDDVIKMKMETVPLDVWNQNYPNDANMSRPVKRIIETIKTKDFNTAIEDFKKQLKEQTTRPNRNNNKFLSGITAHNLGVLHILSGNDDLSIPYFKEAIELKKAAFGPDHPEVSISLDELGIQYFAREMLASSLEAFNEARIIRAKEYGSSSHPGMAMVLNNIACCNFQMANSQDAVNTLQEARDILNHAVGSSAKAELDLLHMAITLCNYGYLQLRMKEYDFARSVFEEALLIQQSVLGDNHRAIRDTLSNIEFTNAFHS